MNNKAINWKRAGIYLETSIKVLVEGKRRFLRFRISDTYDEISVSSNLDFESKALHEDKWFSNEDFCGDNTAESKVKIEQYINSLPAVNEVRILEDTIWCQFGSFELDWDRDWRNMNRSKVEMLSTGVELEIIKEGKKYIILSDKHIDALARVSEDKVLYTLHRLSKEMFDYMNKYGW